MINMIGNDSKKKEQSTKLKYINLLSYKEIDNIL